MHCEASMAHTKTVMTMMDNFKEQGFAAAQVLSGAFVSIVRCVPIGLSAVLLLLSMTALASAQDISGIKQQAESRKKLWTLNDVDQYLRQSNAERWKQDVAAGKKPEPIDSFEVPESTTSEFYGWALDKAATWQGIAIGTAVIFGLYKAVTFALYKMIRGLYRMIFGLYRRVRAMVRFLRSWSFTADKKQLIVLLLASLWISGAVVISFNDDSNRSIGHYGRLQFSNAAIEVMLLSIPAILFGGVCLWWVGRNRQPVSPASVPAQPSATVTIKKV
jgi:hypothetical protein